MSEIKSGLSHLETNLGVAVLVANTRVSESCQWSEAPICQKSIFRHKK